MFRNATAIAVSMWYHLQRARLKPYWVRLSNRFWIMQPTSLTQVSLGFIEFGTTVFHVLLLEDVTISLQIARLQRDLVCRQNVSFATEFVAKVTFCLDFVRLNVTEVAIL